MYTYTYVIQALNKLSVYMGVTQGSVLGPLLFNGYCLRLARVIEKHNIALHMYADDTQLYMEPRGRNIRLARINACIENKIMAMC